MKLPTKETQKDLEDLYNKFQLMKILREEFETIVDPIPLSERGVEPQMAVDALCQMYLHRQADPVTLVGILSPKYGEPQAVADKLLIHKEILEENMKSYRFADNMNILKEIIFEK